MKLDTIIANGCILTANSTFEVIPNGYVGIQEGRIALVGEITAAGVLPEAKEVIDARNGIIMPGLVNTHTHVPMTLFRGLAEDLPLETWLSEHIFPAEAAFVTPENVAIGTALACAEMLLAGTTCFCDGYFLEDHVAEVVSGTGMRAVLGQGVIDFPAPGVADPRENVAAAIAYVKKWQGRSSRITPAIFCHSPYTCSRATLIAAKTAARELGVLFQIHAAETEQEQELIQAPDLASPIQYLAGNHILDASTLLVHAIWLDTRDIDIIEEQGAAVSHNPESNMKLASGIAPVPRCVSQGIRVGLGTDGCASNNDLDLFLEMDTAAKLHKVHTLDPTVMNAETVVKMATIEGAKAIGLGDQIGSIEPGKLADMIVIDTHRPHLMPMYNPISQIVYAARGSDVRDTMVAGQFLVRDRVLQTIDQALIMEKALALGKAIKRHQRRPV